MTDQKAIRKLQFRFFLYVLYSLLLALWVFAMEWNDAKKEIRLMQERKTKIGIGKRKKNKREKEMMEIK